MIRGHWGRGAGRSSPSIVPLVAALLLAACGGTASPPAGTGTVGPAPSAAGSGLPSTTAGPTPVSTAAPTPGDSGAVSTPTAEPGSPAPSGSIAGCSGDDRNRSFFAQAAAAMSWSVYCAILGEGWFVESGSYKLANGGLLEITYRGPGDAHVAMAEGNVCGPTGPDVNVCAPRDTVIGPALMGDLSGELGRLANGLVLDVDRGANPSWRVTGLGLTEDAFLAICGAMLRVESGG